MAWVRNTELSSEAVSKAGIAQKVAVGRLLGLLAAIVLGLNTTFARLAYDAGSNPVTVLGEPLPSVHTHLWHRCHFTR